MLARTVGHNLPSDHCKRMGDAGEFSDLMVRWVWANNGLDAGGLVTSVISPERRVRCRAESAAGTRPEVRRGLPQTLTSSAADLYTVQRQRNTC